MIKVCKFGGSSVASSAQFKKIKKIVDADKTRKIIVASACGKDNKDDYKVTDLLYLCDAHNKYGMSYDDILELIRKKHQEIIDNLHLDFNLETEILSIKEILKKKDNLDELVSRGEYISCRLLAQYLGADFVDAKDVITFNYDGTVNLIKTKEKFTYYMNTKNKIVVPGFYGALENGVIKTFSRGGSDITGSLLANIVDASVYENWTDVSGIYVCDPRIIKDPKKIDIITYNELREMSYMGASVLHDEATFPVKDKKIPINIRNTNKPDDAGTLIVDSTEDVRNIITGITGKKGFLVVSVTKSNSSSEVGYLKKVLTIFENYNVPIVMNSTGVDSFSITVEKKDIKNNIYNIASEIKSKTGAEEVTVSDDLALVCVVGRGMKAKKGMSGKIFSTLGKNNINIKTISQGANEISIIVGVSEEDFNNTIECMYKEFIK